MDRSTTTLPPTRVFNASEFLLPSEGEPVRSVVTESPDAAVVAWIVQPGQTISLHRHPEGQDTWVVLSGRGEYRLDTQGSTQPIAAGDVVVAHRDEAHGVHNHGPEPLVFVSVVSPALSGYEAL